MNLGKITLNAFVFCATIFSFAQAQESVEKNKSASEQKMMQKSQKNTAQDKIVYGTYDEGTEIRQKDINEFINQGYNKQIITLVGALYKILNDNGEGVDKSVFEEMLKLQTDSGITISYLADDLGVSDEVIKKIKTNSYLINGLGIDINGKILIAKYQASHQANQASHQANQASHQANQASHQANQAEGTLEEINAKNQAATRENQAINNIALGH